jgi:hypothetical protein
MTGRRTLREIREQLAAAQAGSEPTTDTPQGRKVLEALDRLADEIAPAEDGRPSSGGEPVSPDEAFRASRRG